MKIMSYRMREPTTLTREIGRTKMLLAELWQIPETVFIIPKIF